jgi:hypothetical protein
MTCLIKTTLHVEERRTIMEYVLTRFPSVFPTLMPFEHVSACLAVASAEEAPSS